MMGHRERMINGDEFDCFHRGWRKMLCVFSKPGVARKTKARFSRRVRKQAKWAAVQEARAVTERIEQGPCLS